MPEGGISPARRRELARLIADAGLSPKEAAARLDIPEATAQRSVAAWHEAFEAHESAPVVASPPASRSGQRLGRSRRVLAGVALVLAFVPVGWVASAALFGKDSTGRSLLGSEPAAVTGQAFRAAAARAPREHDVTLIARVRGPSVKVYKRPAAHPRSSLLRARELDGKRLPLVFLVTQRKGRGWLHVQLPTRPNQSTAWIRTRTARLSSNAWRLRVELGRKRILVWRGARLISTHRIGVGKSVTPTPHGRYYLTDLVKPPNPNGLYGSYAFGLSAHSKVLSSFGAGDGQIGLHGTNNPKSLGTNVSHGCIRVADSVIESYARHLPLGTPIVIAS